MVIKQPYLLFFFCLLSPFALANESDVVKEGEQLYKTHCSACHGSTGGMDMSKRLAPPVIAVRMHYIGSYPDKDSFVMAVADWLEKQDESKSLMRGAIRRFNLMPPVYVSRQNAEKIASYIYEGELEKPAGFEEHVQKMHGKRY